MHRFLHLKAQTMDLKPTQATRAFLTCSTVLTTSRTHQDHGTAPQIKPRKTRGPCDPEDTSCRPDYYITTHETSRDVKGHSITLANTYRLSPTFLTSDLKLKTNNTFEYIICENKLHMKPKNKYLKAWGDANIKQKFMHLISPWPYRHSHHICNLRTQTRTHTPKVTLCTRQNMSLHLRCSTVRAALRTHENIEAAPHNKNRNARELLEPGNGKNADTYYMAPPEGHGRDVQEHTDMTATRRLSKTSAHLGRAISTRRTVRPTTRTHQKFEAATIPKTRNTRKLYRPRNTICGKVHCMTTQRGHGRNTLGHTEMTVTCTVRNTTITKQPAKITYSIRQNLSLIHILTLPTTPYV